MHLWKNIAGSAQAPSDHIGIINQQPFANPATNPEFGWGLRSALANPENSKFFYCTVGNGGVIFGYNKIINV